MIFDLDVALAYITHDPKGLIGANLKVFLHVVFGLTLKCLSTLSLVGSYTHGLGIMVWCLY